MVATNPQATNDLLIDLARARRDGLPWAKKYVNTTITMVGTLATVATMVLGLGMELDPRVVAGLVAVIKIGEVLGVKSSKPQPTTAQIATWKELIPEHVDTANMCGKGC